MWGPRREVLKPKARERLGPGVQGREHLAREFRTCAVSNAEWRKWNSAVQWKGHLRSLLNGMEYLLHAHWVSGWGWMLCKNREFQAHRKEKNTKNSYIPTKLCKNLTFCINSFTFFLINTLLNKQLKPLCALLRFGPPPEVTPALNLLPIVPMHILIFLLDMHNFIS